MAPGEDILVLNPDDQAGIGSGTSYATPIVSGTISLLLKYKPDASALEIKDAILKNADTFDHLRKYVKDGRVLNAKRAINNFCKRSPV